MISSWVFSGASRSLLATGVCSVVKGSNGSFNKLLLPAFSTTYCTYHLFLVPYSKWETIKSVALLICIPINKIIRITSENSVSKTGGDMRPWRVLCFSFFFLFSRGVGHAGWGQGRHRKRWSVQKQTEGLHVPHSWYEDEVKESCQHPQQEAEVMARWPPPHATILAHKQYLSMEHVLTLVKRYAAGCHISFLQTHTHATMHIVHPPTHTLPLSVYTAYLLSRHGRDHTVLTLNSYNMSCKDP